MSLYILYFLLPYVLPVPPAPGVVASRSDAREYVCEHMSVQATVDRYPGRVAEPKPRGDYIERDVMMCQQRVLRGDLRLAKDEAILLSLEARANELAADARARYPELEDHTWMVEVYYPSGSVSGKISFAAQNALMAQGLTVSDRAPTLAAGDVQVLTRMSPWEAYPAACQRYHSNGSVGADEALLAVMTLDPQETALHAGLCEQGRWTWLR